MRPSLWKGIRVIIADLIATIPVTNIMQRTNGKRALALSPSSGSGIPIRKHIRRPRPLIFNLGWPSRSDSQPFLICSRFGDMTIGGSGLRPLGAADKLYSSQYYRCNAIAARRDTRSQCPPAHCGTSRYAV